MVAAMHVNTKELPSWAFQSVWWSPMSDVLAECPLADVNHCFGQSAGYAATSANVSRRPAAWDSEVSQTAVLTSYITGLAGHPLTAAAPAAVVSVGRTQDPCALSAHPPFVSHRVEHSQ